MKDWFSGGKQWPLAIAAFLAAVALLDGAMIYVATTDPSFIVESDYYRKAQNWDAEKGKQLASDALQWNLELKFLEPLPDRTVPLEARITSKDGSPVEDAVVRFEGFAHRDARNPRSGAMASQGDGTYRTVLPYPRKGAWKLRLSARHADALFIEEQTLVMP